MDKKRITHVHMLQLVQTWLKAAILAKGSDIVVSKELCAKAENEFDLKMNLTDDDCFRLSLSQGEKDRPAQLHLPKDSGLWTP